MSSSDPVFTPWLADNANCVGRIHYPFTSRVSNITMIAVGVGLAPMIHTLRAIFKDYDLNKNKNVDDCLESVTDGLPDSKNNDNSTSKDLQIVLLYGVVSTWLFVLYIWSPYILSQHFFDP